MSQQTHAAATQLPWQERLRATPPTRIVVRVAIAALALFVVLWVLVLADEALSQGAPDLLPRPAPRSHARGPLLRRCERIHADLRLDARRQHGARVALPARRLLRLRSPAASRRRLLGQHARVLERRDVVLGLVPAAHRRVVCGRGHRSRHATGLPALEPGSGATTGADHDRDLGHPRRPDARPLRRAGGGVEAPDQLAHERQRRRRLRLLPPRRARVRDRDRHRALPRDPPELASA